MTLRLTLFGPPCTSKNSAVLIGGKTPRMLPSQTYRDWTKAQMVHKAKLAQSLAPHIPVVTACSLEAIFFRVQDSGDLCGYLQAVGDILQEEIYRCEKCHKQTPKSLWLVGGRKCRHCSFPALKRTRDGLGIIANDVLIRDFDGSRLGVDAKNPRVELTIRTYKGD